MDEVRGQRTEPLPHLPPEETLESSMELSLTEVSGIKLLRREWIAGSIAVASSLAWSSAASVWAKPKDKSSVSSTGLFRVRSVLEINGEIRLRSQTNDATDKGGKKIVADRKSVV